MSVIITLDSELSNEWFTKLKIHQHNTSQERLKHLRYERIHLKKFLSLDVSRLEDFLYQFPFPDNSDEEMMWQAMQHYGGAFPHLSETLRSKREFALEGVKFDGKFLEFTSDELRNDREVVMEAIDENAAALEFASEALKDDASIVERAVEGQVSDIIRFASERLRDSKKIARVAVDRHAIAYCYLSDRLQNDIDFAESCVGWDRYAGRNQVHLYMPSHVEKKMRELFYMDY